jgi:hypothetical protein
LILDNSRDHQNERTTQMKAEPKVKKKDMIDKLPKRIALLYGDPNGQPNDSQGREVHDKLDVLKADPLAATAPATADSQNRELAKQIRAVFSSAGKPNDNLTDPIHGPRFILTWRMYPNDDNPNVHASGSCGCGCSCS